MYALVAAACLVVYIIGLPFGMFMALYKNRQHLFDTASKEHERVKASYGGLYLQYEEKYWWFEMVVVLQKMIMTGAMCVIAPGSSLQLLAAVLVTLIYMLLVLKTAPYEEDSEDYTSFVACLTLTLTTVGGLLLITDHLSTPTYESTLLGALLIAMSVCCIAVEIGIVVLIDCGVYEKICGRQGGRKQEVSGGNRTQVLPVTMMNQEDELSARAKKAPESKDNQKSNQKRMKKDSTKVLPVEIKILPQESVTKERALKEMKETRLKFGAGSEEYKAAAKKYSNSNKSKTITKKNNDTTTKTAQQKRGGRGGGQKTRQQSKSKSPTRRKKR